MKNDWSIRWWDILALAAAVIIAVVVVQYAVVRSGSEGTKVNPSIVALRVPQPLPELVSQLAIGDPILNFKNEKVAEIFSVQPIAKIDDEKLPVPLFGKQDLLVTLRVYGNLRLIRDLPGFPKEPAQLKAGVWCLMSTPNVELSGMVVKVKPLPEKGEKTP